MPQAVVSVAVPRRTTQQVARNPGESGPENRRHGCLARRLTEERRQGRPDGRRGHEVFEHLRRTVAAGHQEQSCLRRRQQYGERRPPAQQQPLRGAPQWLRWLGIAALGNGASWGLAGGVFFRSLSDEQQVFLAFLFAGMASVGIPVYAASLPIFARTFNREDFPDLKIRWEARPESASPATGSPMAHHWEQNELLMRTLAW